MKKIIVGIIFVTLVMTNSACGKKNNGINIYMSDDKTYIGILYLDPADKTANCNEKIAATNVNEYGTPTGVNSGCMKWYLYKDLGDSYKAILDHNTTKIVVWNDNSEAVPLEESNLQPLLDELSSKWVNTNSYITNVSLISRQEIADITGITSHVYGYYFLDSKNQTEKMTGKGTSKYAWLYDYTYDCENYGCNYSDDEASKGYWTSSLDTNVCSACAWTIQNENYFGSKNVGGWGVGLRPVITIPKSVLN